MLHQLITIIDPEKYQKIAKHVLDEKDVQSYSQTMMFSNHANTNKQFSRFFTTYFGGINNQFELDNFIAILFFSVVMIVWAILFSHLIKLPKFEYASPDLVLILMSLIMTCVCSYIFRFIYSNYLALMKKIKNKLGIKEYFPAEEFLDLFVNLKHKTRDFLEKSQLISNNGDTVRGYFSFRNMVEIMLNNNKVDKTFANELLQLYSIRNLVFHGHIKSVNCEFKHRTEEAILKIEKME